MFFVLRYELVDDFLQRRRAFRAEHIALALKAAARGELRLGGALALPSDEALLLFSGTDPGVAEGFARADPYVREGLVRRWSVRPWIVVVGTDFLA